MNSPATLPTPESLNTGRRTAQSPEALAATRVVTISERTPYLTRMVEIVFSACVLVLALPIMLVVGLIIRLGTPGPVLFRQIRMGINQKPFRFVKFRTMFADARQRFPHLYEYRYTEEEIQQLKFKIVDDPRVTPQGKWLRTSTLDELPNFWNVLTGDMALVGPRPEIPDMLPYYSGEQLLKFTVRPGVTGLAQISGRGRLSFQDTVALDVEYVRNRTFGMDMKILVLTIFKMLTSDGAF